MSPLLKTIFWAFGILAAVVLVSLLLAGWPGRSIAAAWEETAFYLFFGSLLEGVVLIIIGVVLATGRGSRPPGSIGTEDPADVPENYFSRRDKGVSFLIAGALLLLVGTSVCWGSFWL